jgi:hypothetical protein
MNDDTIKNREKIPIKNTGNGTENRRFICIKMFTERQQYNIITMYGLILECQDPFGYYERDHLRRTE